MEDPSLAKSADVLYPACDSDLFARPDAVKILGDLLMFGRSVSVSTKARLSPDTVRSLAVLATKYRKRGLLLKVSVSVSATKHARRLEPRTPSPEARLRSLVALARAGVPTSLNLRPVLVDVPISEYCEMLDLVAAHTRHVLLGEEWLDDDELLRRHLIDGELADATGKRSVSWLGHPDVWSYRPASSHLRRIAEHAESLDLHIAHTDTQLVEQLLVAHVHQVAPRP
jgi:hypothetical protein